MNTNESRGSVLIVATDRDDRRVLFDALDSQEFDAIYTAKDVAQARAFLEQDPQIDLVLLEFLDDARGALAFCGELRQYHPGAPVPVVAVCRMRTGPTVPLSSTSPLVGRSAYR